MNEDSSRSQHGEFTASLTGGTDQLNAYSELRIQIFLRANSAEKVPDTQRISCLDHHTRRCSQSQANVKATSTEPSLDTRQDVMTPDSNAGKAVLQKQLDLIKK